MISQCQRMFAYAVQIWMPFLKALLLLSNRVYNFYSSDENPNETAACCMYISHHCNG